MSSKMDTHDRLGIISFLIYAETYKGLISSNSVHTRLKQYCIDDRFRVLKLYLLILFTEHLNYMTNRPVGLKSQQIIPAFFSNNHTLVPLT